MATIQKRNTIQRKLVSDAVHELKNHPTAEDIYQKVIKSHPSISRGTVYRNLNYLVEDGFIRKVSIFDGADRFDYTLNEHRHIKCSVCEQIFDIMPEDKEVIEKIVSLESNLAETSSFDISGYEILFVGVCPTCKRNKTKIS